jgi:hypothetical protein
VQSDQSSSSAARERRRAQWSPTAWAILVVLFVVIALVAIVVSQGITPGGSGREIADRALAEMQKGHSVEPSQPESASSSVDEDDFIDNTADYAGREITLTLDVASSIFGDAGDSLRSYAGKSVDFTARTSSSNHLNLRIQIPRAVKDELPNAVFNDTLEVTFKCTKGDLRRGNVAERIVRVTRR